MWAGILPGLPCGAEREKKACCSSLVQCRRDRVEDRTAQAVDNGSPMCSCLSRAPALVMSSAMPNASSLPMRLCQWALISLRSTWPAIWQTAIRILGSSSPLCRTPRGDPLQLAGKVIAHSQGGFAFWHDDPPATEQTVRVPARLPVSSRHLHTTLVHSLWVDR